MAEILDLVDADRKPLHRTVLRGGNIPAGCYVTVVNVMTVNSAGKILMTRRARNKTLPGCWEITGGAKIAGETPAEAAVRELFEETGIQIAQDELIYCGEERRTRWFNLYYLCYKDVPRSAIRLQRGETDGARWVSREECLTMVQADTRRCAESFLLHYPQIFCNSQAQEQYDVYDAEKHRTGAVLGSDIKPPPGTYKLLVTVMTVNDDGEILMTKRAPNKSFPGKWELSGGHVQAGEKAEEAAVRELFEETGIRTTRELLDYRGDFFIRHCIFSMYLLRKNVPIQEIRLQPGETVDAKWVTPKELLRMLENDETVLYNDEVLFTRFADVLA